MEHKTHYRVLRSTIVLAKHSEAYAEIEDSELRAAVGQAIRKNYQFDQIDDSALEVLFAHFDEDFTRRVRREFVFYPRAGSVRVHAEAVAICDLCGKGDSKETGDNKDHLRIEFLLTNTAGGSDVWCGSTCIINFGLKVDGAKTAEEAERLLGMSMRQAVRQFKINAWRAEHPDHTDIPDQYQELRQRTAHAQANLHNHFGELVLAGFDMGALTRVRGVTQTFRTASRFYQREGYLTPAKQADWDDAKRALAAANEMQQILKGAMDIHDPDARFDYFVNLYTSEKSTNGQAA